MFTWKLILHLFQIPLGLQTVQPDSSVISTTHYEQNHSIVEDLDPISINSKLDQIDQQNWAIVTF